MFRLSRQIKGSKSGERFDFKFSNFQAVQVPKGWDRLYVYLVSAETGKTVSKMNKTSVQGGICQWSESISESIWFSQHDSSKEHNESLFKFVVSMGSTRSSILGEATVNMASYVSSKSAAPVILPLKNCNHGTVLQVKIQCLNPRPKLGDESSINTKSHIQEPNADDHPEMLNQNTYPYIGSPTHEEKLRSRQTSFSASGSNPSFDSAEGSLQKEDLSPMNELNGSRSNRSRRRRGSNSSYDSSLNGNYFSEDSPSNDSRFLPGNQNSPGIPFSSPRNANSSKNLLESAGETIEELRSEARMWERNARKLKVDLDVLRKQCTDLSRSESEMGMQLSAACTERDGLKEEVEQMKLDQKECALNSLALENSLFQSKGTIGIQKELETELRLLQESNANLAQQLQRSQESNIELVDILQELELTIEKQKAEIDNLSSSSSKHLEDNQSLLLQIQQFQESENKLNLDLQLLKQTLEQKEIEMEDEQSANRPTILDLETKYESEVDPLKENKDLKEKLQELEKDCDELTNENLELLLKLKNTALGEGVTVSSKSEAGSKKENGEDGDPSYHEVSNSLNNLIQQLDIAFCNIRKPWSILTGIDSDDVKLDSSCRSNMSDPKRLADYALDLFIELNKLLETRISQVEAVLQHRETNKLDENMQLSESISELQNEAGLAEKLNQVENLFNQKTIEVEDLKMEIENLNNQISSINNEKERIASEAAVTVSNLQTSKADLERAHEDELHNARAESGIKVEALMIELSNTVENHHKLKTALTDIELKFVVSDHEHQKLLEETANLKLQLQKTAHLPDENMVLKTELDSCKSEKEHLERSILSVSRECEEKKAALTQALEANNKYKFQLQRGSSITGESPVKERIDRTRSSLEAELKDLRDRYLRMSLEYAEVESQRENLVMQLKMVKTGKRWF